MAQIEKIIKSEGHLIDSNLMCQIFDTIIDDGGSYEILEFKIGKNNNEVSQAKLKIKTNNPAVVTKLKDRGSMQTIGLVTDVGLFLHLLAEMLIKKS